GAGHARRPTTCVTDRGKARRQGCRRSLCSAPADGIPARAGSAARGQQFTMMPPDHNMTEANRGCGERLRVAREAAGLSLEDVATRLTLPVRVVRSLEEEDWSRLRSEERRVGRGG